LITNNSCKCNVFKHRSVYCLHTLSSPLSIINQNFVNFPYIVCLCRSVSASYYGQKYDKSSSHQTLKDVTLTLFGFHRFWEPKDKLVLQSSCIEKKRRTWHYWCFPASKISLLVPRRFSIFRNRLHEVTPVAWWKCTNCRANFGVRGLKACGTVNLCHE